MGFLKRFFSIRHKQKSARNDGRTHINIDNADTAVPQDDSDTRLRVLDNQSAIQLPWPENGTADEDADVAVSRLLRSSSTHYKVVEEADYTILPPLPHPINTVSSRSTPVLALSPHRSATVQTKGSYRVTVHKRQQLSATVFPNAYPPQTPRRPGIAHTSTPNLLATYTASHDGMPVASTSTASLLDPRKIPVTPRDASRLNRLRQDPSVVSLVRLYDNHGRLAENAFTTTPAPPRRRLRARKSRRKSTFNELLGCHGDDDLQWAEACIAQQGELASTESVSNASTTSLSSTDTPPLDSPATSTFNDVEFDREVPTPAPGMARDPSTSTVTGQEKDAGFSSLVVELSMASSAATFDSDDRPIPYTGPYRQSQREKGKEKESPSDKKDHPVSKTTSQPAPAPSKVVRKPSQRASQVFNFIGEKRERRKSQELLQGSGITIPISANDPMLADIAADSVTIDEYGAKYATIPRARTSSQAQVFTGSLGSRIQLRVKSPSARDGLGVGASPELSSQVTLRIPPRSDAAASTSTLIAHPANSTAQIGKPAKGSTAALILLQEQREREKDRKRAEAARKRDVQTLPATSTPHPSKVAHFRSGKRLGLASKRVDNGRSTLGEMTNVPTSVQGDDALETASLDLRYDSFAANLDARMQQLQAQSQGKEAGSQPMTRRRGATIDLGSTPLVSNQRSAAPTTKYVHFEAPQTPTRSLSLRGQE